MARNIGFEIAPKKDILLQEFLIDLCAKLFELLDYNEATCLPFRVCVL
jgi:hypothetical protein